jgi:CDP-glucose 4,6-dehydratase
MDFNFGGIYSGKKVFLTGHTGFKGSWLALWLKELGADICGYSLELDYSPTHLGLLNLGMKSIIGDIRDSKKLEQAIVEYQPDFIFHLAAQPLVRYSYENPVETYETNVLGVVNLFEAVKKCNSIKGILNVTTDKCYENKEWIWGYRENEALGGYDPYSASKACSEIVTSSYRNSFFNIENYGQKHNCLVASARAGNVIGGGDWAGDRLIPDIVRAIEKGDKVEIRSPNATRPWQHVLEPLSGYLAVGERLLEGKTQFAQAWNFGPEEKDTVNVEKIVKEVKKSWDIFQYEINQANANVHEAGLLKLDSTKARVELNWNGKWDYANAIEKTITWYKDFFENKKVNSIDDLRAYCE